MSKEEIALNLVKAWLEQRENHRNVSYLTISEITEHYIDCLTQLKKEGD